MKMEISLRTSKVIMLLTNRRCIMTEPTDTEILEFLLNQFKSHSLKMNGESEWYFINTGFPMSRAKGKTARDAVINAMRAK